MTVPPGLINTETRRPPGDLQVFFRRYAELDQADRARWAELSSRAGSENIYAHDWIMDAALTFCDQERQVRLLIVAADDGRWRGVLPIASSKRFGRWRVRTWQLWSATNQFLLTPLVLPQAADVFWRSVLSFLDAQPGGHWTLYCPQLADDSAVSAALIACCRADGRSLYRLKSYSRAAKFARPAIGAPIAVPSKSQRKLASRLRSLSARLARDHGAVEITLHAAGRSPDEWIDAFLALEQSGWKGRAGSALACIDGTEGFFRTLIQRGCENGSARLATLKANGHTIAMISCLVTDRHGFGFKMAYDEKYSDYAPGQLLMQHMAGLMDQQPELYFDTCSAPDSPHCKHIWPDRRPLFVCAVAIGSPGRRLAFRALMALRLTWHRMRDGLAALPFR